MDNKLVIRELKEVASVPNGFDEKILLQIQENLAMDVLRLHKRDFAGLMLKQMERGTPPAEAEPEEAVEPEFPPEDLEQARQRGRDDAAAGKRIFDNPYLADDPRHHLDVWP